MTSTETPEARMARLRREVDARRGNGPCEDAADGIRCDKPGCVRDVGILRCRRHAWRYLMGNLAYSERLKRIVREVVDADRADALRAGQNAGAP